MPSQETSLFERLSQAENPYDLKDWEGRDGYYVAACRISAEDVPGLIDMARKWSDPNWLDEVDDSQLVLINEAELLPVTAWRSLADLKADAAVEPLVDVLCASEDEFDDWLSEELPHVFGKIGPSAMDPLMRVAADGGKPDHVRSVAVRGLGRVAHYHPDTRDRIVAGLTELMTAAADGQLEFNNALLVELVELQAVEGAEAIERAFAGNLLDVAMIGTWEVVRRTLGVEGLGLTMPENPHNSIERLRRRMGLGIFSDRPLFTSDGIDDDAAQKYFEQADVVFSRSSEAQKVVERHGDLGWFRMFLEFGVNRGETVDEMTLGSVSEFVLDYMPRKVSTEADSAASIVFELEMFWQYLDRVYSLPQAKPIVEWLQSEGLVAQLKQELSDPSNFGIAKSFFMAGTKAGYDMTSQEGLAEFASVYNQSLASARASAPPPATLRNTAPIVRSQRVGRNDPCPCGSGKKHKKCCGSVSKRKLSHEKGGGSDAFAGEALE